MPKHVGDETGFAAQLLRLRTEAGLSREELAGRAGMHPLSVAKLEQGVRGPAWATVLTLAKALGVEVGAFVVRDPAPPPVRPRGRPKKDEAEPSGQKAAPKKGRGGRSDHQ